MASAKEKCFGEALEAYNEAHRQKTGHKLDIKYKQPWVQDTVTGAWRMEDRGFWAGVNSMLKTFANKLDPSKPPGSAVQVREPDITITTDEGTWVVDNKFSRADGSKDDWGKDRGAGNRNTQRQDYDSINRQYHPDEEQAQDLKLDRDTCNCKGEPAKEMVEIPYPAFMFEPHLFFMPVPHGSLGTLPGWLDELGRALEGGPKPVFEVP